MHAYWVVLLDCPMNSRWLLISFNNKININLTPVHCRPQTEPWPMEDLECFLRPIILLFLCTNSSLSTTNHGLFFNPYLTLHNFPSSGQNLIYYGPLSPSSWAKPSTMMMILIIIINIFFFENHYSVIIIMLVKIKERNKVKKRH